MILNRGKCDLKTGLPLGLVWVLIAASFNQLVQPSWGQPSSGQSAAHLAETNRLMPGIRSRDINDPAWPRTMHDRLATGFSPLACGMKEAPRVWSSVELGGQSASVHVLRATDTEDQLLVDDGRLRLLSSSGNVLWTSSETGSLVYYGDQYGNRKDGRGRSPAENLAVGDRPATATAKDNAAAQGGAAREYLFMSSGSRLFLLDPHNGKTLWSHRFSPPHVQVRAAVADLIPEQPGLEAAVVLQWGEEGCVINFPPDGEPKFVWQRPVVVPGEYDERYDHGCDLRLDQSVPEKPLIWNVRRYRCRGFDARTGEMVSSIAYNIGGEQRRNYGSWELGRGEGGRPLVCVVADRVQLHVHGIRLHRSGENELAWQHYYGEVYKDAPGAAMDYIAIDDLDGDGKTEVAYSVCDPAHDNRSFVRIRDGDTGDVKYELADCWGVAAFRGVGVKPVNGLLVYSAPNGTMPQRGDLRVYCFKAPDKLELVGAAPQSRTWGPTTIATPEGNQLLVRETDAQGASHVVRYTIEDFHLNAVSRAPKGALSTSPIQAVARRQNGDTAFIALDSEGGLSATTWQGQTLWTLPLQGGAVPAVCAADLDGDGRAELIAAGAGNGLRVFSVDDAGTCHERQRFDGSAEKTPGPTPRGSQKVGVGHGRVAVNQMGSSVCSPLAFDLESNGKLCLIAPGATADDKLVVRAFLGDGSLLWESKLDAPGSRVAIVINAGQFLPRGKAGVAVSLAHEKRSFEGTFLLEGATGKMLWRKGLYHDGPICMPYRTNGIPTAFDIDGDGAEEIGMDMLSYMAYLRGVDGSFAYLQHTPNIRTENATYAGHLYNTYCPFYKQASDNAPHWLVTAGFGRFGLMNPNPREGVWRVDLGYDVPPHIGLIDVDGDGELEVGYAAINSKSFVCRNAATGTVEWELALPYPPNAPVITADADGDGKGEFLVGAFCIGVESSGKGKLLWQAPRALGWAAIADFDGDGRGEIACPISGGVAILKGSAR